MILLEQQTHLVEIMETNQKTAQFGWQDAEIIL